MNTKVSGIEGEAEAYRYAVSRGLKPIEKNYRRAGGEIDLIAMDGDTVVFIEVKARMSPRYGSAAEAVNASKRRCVVRAALSYLQSHRLMDARVRFDVIAIDGGQIRYIENAFDASDFV